MKRSVPPSSASRWSSRSSSGSRPRALAGSPERRRRRRRDARDDRGVRRITPDVHTFGEPVVATVEVVAMRASSSPTPCASRPTSLRTSSPASRRSSATSSTASRASSSATRSGASRRAATPPRRAASRSSSRASSATASSRGPGRDGTSSTGRRSRSPRASRPATSSSSAGARARRRSRPRPRASARSARRACCSRSPLLLAGVAALARSPALADASRRGRVEEERAHRSPLERALELVLADSRNGDVLAGPAPSARAGRARAHAVGQDGPRGRGARARLGAGRGVERRRRGPRPARRRGDGSGGRVSGFEPASGPRLPTSAAAELGREHRRTRLVRLGLACSPSGAARRGVLPLARPGGAADQLLRDGQRRRRRPRPLVERRPAEGAARAARDPLDRRDGGSRRPRRLLRQRVRDVPAGHAERGAAPDPAFLRGAARRVPARRASAASVRRRRRAAARREESPWSLSLPRRHEDLDGPRRGARDRPARGRPVALGPAAQRSRQLRLRLLGAPGGGHRVRARGHRRCG